MIPRLQATTLTHVEDIESVFGSQLLSYLIGTDDGTLPAAPSDGQRAVIEILEHLVPQLQGQDAPHRLARLQEVLLAYQDEQDTTLANVLRVRATGKARERSRLDDPVAEELLRLASNSYPGYLLPQVGQYGMVLASPSDSILRHPANYRFMREVLADAGLSCLFPAAHRHEPDGENDLLKVQTYLIVSSGHGGGLQLARFADRLLKNSYERMAIIDSAGIDTYFGIVLGVLKEMRSLALGEQLEIPVGVGLVNIKLPAGQRFGVRGLEIRATKPEDSRWLLPLSVPSSVVLTTTMPLKLLQIGIGTLTDSAQVNAGFEKYEPAFEMARKALQRRIELARFALLLASRLAPYHAAQQGMTRIFDPLYEVAMASAPNSAPSSSPETTVESLSFAAIESWMLKIQNHPRGLDIAMRRLLSAATSRSDPLDGLIDAVLAWENMFSGTPETNLRVCGAISYLLEPTNYQMRQQLFDELKKLYTTRSSLVHGSSELGIREAGIMRDRAVDIGLQSMRRLYDYPDLLRLRSTARSRNILLGAMRNGDN